MRTRMSGSMSGDWRRSHGASIATPPDERGGNSREAPTTTAPVVDSTRGGPGNGAGRRGKWLIPKPLELPIAAL